MSASTQEIQ